MYFIQHAFAWTPAVCSKVMSISSTDHPPLTSHPFTVPLCLSEHKARNIPSITSPLSVLTSGSVPGYPSNLLILLPPLFPSLITGSLPGGWKRSKKQQEGEGDKEGGGRLWQRGAEALSNAGQNVWPSAAPKPEGLLAHWWLGSWRPDADAAKVCRQKTLLPGRPPVNPRGKRGNV